MVQGENRVKLKRMGRDVPEGFTAGINERSAGAISV